LDTLDPSKFKRITRVDAFEKVKDNLDALLERNFNVKLNMVVMNGINETEISDFVEWTRHKAFHIRFIEFMPFKGNDWEKTKVFSYHDMMEQITEKYDVIKIQDKPHDTDKKYQVKDFKGTFGIISTVTAPFCSDCNRLRLTADGKMKNCLFSQSETDLLSVYRTGGDIRPLILQTVEAKFASFGGQELGSKMNNRSMISIGG
jgi:cyclic pyranopterin phosphate synthase